LKEQSLDERLTFKGAEGISIAAAKAAANKMNSQDKVRYMMRDDLPKPSASRA
jgi:hypothetical protein